MNLKHLTNTTLLKDISTLASRERELTSQVLWHLREIDQRKLYSELKCSSLFDYCVKKLKYSEGQASRRVKACRMLEDLPSLAQKIEDGSLNLSLINQAGSFFKDENIKDPKIKEKVINQIEGKSTRETEAILGKLRSDDTPRNINISLRENTVQELRKLQADKAHTCPDLSTLLDKMIVDIKEVWVPMAPQRNRISQGKTRHIPIAVKQRLKKDAKCANCGSNYALQIDHIKPFSKGGRTQESNLQILCRNCNQWKGSKNPRSLALRI